MVNESLCTEGIEIVNQNSVTFLFVVHTKNQLNVKLYGQMVSY